MYIYIFICIIGVCVVSTHIFYRLLAGPGALFLEKVERKKEKGFLCLCVHVQKIYVYMDAQTQKSFFLLFLRLFGEPDALFWAYKIALEI